MAVFTSSSDFLLLLFPYDTLKSTEPLNITAFCGIYPNLLFNVSSLYFLTFIPSTKTSPSLAS